MLDITIALSRRSLSTRHAPPRRRELATRRPVADIVLLAQCKRSRLVLLFRIRLLEPREVRLKLTRRASERADWPGWALRSPLPG